MSSIEVSGTVFLKSTLGQEDYMTCFTLRGFLQLSYKFLQEEVIVKARGGSFLRESLQACSCNWKVVGI